MKSSTPAAARSTRSARRARRRGPGIVGIAALLLTVAACGTRDASDRPGDTAGGEQDSGRPARHARRSYGTVIDTLWRIDGARAESLFTEAHFLAAGVGRLYVADAEHGILAFDRTGRALWRSALPVDVTAFPASPGAMVVVSDTLLIVADRGNGTLRHLTSDGRFTAAHRLDAQWTLHSICALSDETLMLTSGEAPLGVVALDGRTLRLPAYPWPAFRDEDRMLQQSVVASAPGDPGCVIAQSAGNGFAVTTHGERFDTASYIERRPLPEIIVRVDSVPDGVVTTRAMPPDHAPTAERVAATPTRIYIGYGGDTPRREGLVDVYDRPSLAYRGSAKLGVPIRALAAAGDTLYVLHEASGEVALLALRLREPLP